MRKNLKNQKGFTLIELLVVIAIIAILAVVVILTLNPAELLRQSRDSNRVSDFATLKSALGLYAEDVSTSTTMQGTATTTPTSTIYLSGPNTLGGVVTTLASSSAGCQTSTPSAGGWGYLGGEGSVVSSTAGSAARAINGAGWIPLNLSAISSGAPISALPVDPVNAATNVYSYVGAATTYKLSTKTESTKYSQGGTGDVDSTDGGNSTCALESGTNIAGL